MVNEKIGRIANRVLNLIGIAVVIHSLFILAYVTKANDPGIRIMLVDEEQADESVPADHGPRIAQVLPNLEFRGDLPEAGDYLSRIARRKITTFSDFTYRLDALQNVVIPPGGQVDSTTNLVAMQDQLTDIFVMKSVDPVTGQDVISPPWVGVEYYRPADRRQHVCWIQLQPLSPRELVQSFLWFILEFGIFMVGALAFWTRPFDRQARLFYAVCVVTMGGFIGGYHWWLIAGSPWLTIPFTVCAMLLPVVTLHFFSVYPEPIKPFRDGRLLPVLALYAFPVVCITSLVGLMGYAWWLQETGAPPSEVFPTLERLSVEINFYFAVAAAYFVATLAALLYSFFRHHNPLVHSQVKWILGAALLATIPVGYTLYLSRFHKVEFALGHASLPMFTASLLFMLAYTVGIVRFKLMLVDQILSRGMLYYVVSFLVTLGYSAAIAASSLLSLFQTAQISQRAVSVMAIVIVTVLLMGWFRDRLQQMIDRRFFREKYQLDKALLRVNQGAGAGPQLAPELIAERMLVSCRDVLGITRAALYLRDPGDFVLRLLASEGNPRPPAQFPFDQQFLVDLQAEYTQTRAAEDAQEPASRAQSLLRDFNLELVHALEIEGHVGGVVLLGPKTSGIPFTAEDLTFLATLAQITSVALHSARVHQTAARLNDELQSQVEKESEQQRTLTLLQSERQADQQKIAEQQRLLTMLQAEIRSRRPGSPPIETETFHRDLIKGSSPAVVRVLETVRKVSGSQSSVLIRGESGTGKELLAQTLHDNSPRRNKPLISVHCGALSSGVLESELFGHVKGAFTGAHRDRQGRFELANGGTLFLDEIGDISLETQIKLLRVLQERRFESVGGSTTQEVDVRLIAATHQPLERLIAAGKFREDLFYRLNVISITLPPLRDRGDDIFELAQHFLARAAERSGKHVTHFDEDALSLLQRNSWPGNIRELENAIERAVVLAERSVISAADLPPLQEGLSPVDPHTEPYSSGTRSGAVTSSGVSSPGSHVASLQADVALQENSEREQLQDALRRSNGNKAEAARLLGMPRSTFFSKLKKHSLP